jgi:hypothetical protein
VAAATLRTTREGPGGLRQARLSSRRSATLAKVGFAALCVGALIGYFAYPTYPTYDSFYALLWGRDLLHLHLPDFHVYRGPTEHPLAIAFGMLCSIFGQGGARLMVLGSIVSFVAVVAGAYRLGRLCFGPVVGLVAALLVLSRFFVENLSAQGYLDISYVALIVWALVLEVERPRRGAVVLLTLAAAGLLRPDAWVLSGVYWLWCVWPARGQREATDGQPGATDGGQPRAMRGKRRTTTNRTRLQYLALAAIAPVVWVLVDGIVTGNPLYSLSSTAGLAQELERTQGFSTVLVSVWTYGVRIDKLPVVLGGLVGVGLAIWLTPRRVGVPLCALVLLVLVYVAEGAVGASVIDRYLMGAAIVLLLFCAVTVGGWTMLERGSKLRRVWMAGAAALVLYGGFSVATTLSLSSLRTTLAYHESFHKGLANALASPAVKAQLRRCPLLSLPNNKLIPDARWILDSVGQRDIVARSQARADVAKGSHTLENRIRRGSVAVYPLGSAVFFKAIVDVGDDPRDQIPLAGFRRVYTSRYYAVYAGC